MLPCVVVEASASNLVCLCVSQPKFYGMSYVFVPDDAAAVGDAYNDLAASGALTIVAPLPAARVAAGALLCSFGCSWPCRLLVLSRF